jgi:RNA recognition motif-containing protein
MYLVNEKLLRDIFSSFGAVADVSIKKHTYAEEKQRQAGYGFVYFYDQACATQAITMMKKRTVENISFDLNMVTRDYHQEKPNRLVACELLSYLEREWEFHSFGNSDQVA